MFSEEKEISVSEIYLYISRKILTLCCVSFIVWNTIHTCTKMGRGLGEVPFQEWMFSSLHTDWSLSHINTWPQRFSRLLFVLFATRGHLLAYSVPQSYLSRGYYFFWDALPDSVPTLNSHGWPLWFSLLCTWTSCLLAHVLRPAALEAPRGQGLCLTGLDDRCLTQCLTLDDKFRGPILL